MKQKALQKKHKLKERIKETKTKEQLEESFLIKQAKWELKWKKNPRKVEEKPA